MLLNAGLGPVAHGAVAPPGSMALDAGAVSTAPLILRVFKALQLLVSRRYARPFLDFTAIDIETTDKVLGTAEVVELAAVRVRAGRREEEFRTFVRPGTPIAPEATAVHGITNDDVRDAPSFAEVWPAFREFCGADTLVAHNGCDFDFPILHRLSRSCGGGRFPTFDTLLLAKEVHRGRHRLEDIALAYGIETGTKHRALDDARHCLGDALVERGRALGATEHQDARARRSLVRRRVETSPERDAVGAHRGRAISEPAEKEH